MSRELMQRDSSLTTRRKPLINKKTPHIKAQFAEVVGGTAAECAAICCCCPCGVANFLLLAFYKLPAGCCRRILRKKRRMKMIKKGVLRRSSSSLSDRQYGCGFEEKEMHIHPFAVGNLLAEMKKMEKTLEVEKEKMEELEKEMWAQFYSTGFWRSPSQREGSELSTS